ncbi:MAG: hypothetical protein V3V00_14190 [Saprospiraceae bacterium]
MNFRHALIGIVSILFISGYFIVDHWDWTMNNGDSSGYYFHVVSVFINQDVGDYNETIKTYLEYYPTANDPRDDPYGIRITDLGKRYIKYTIGVGIMEFPAFIIGHLIALSSDSYEANGWSIPYTFSVHLSKVLYILIGLYFLIKILEEYFSRNVIVLTILSIAFATNLFFHGTFLTLAHSFLFFDICLLIFLSNNFYKTPSSIRGFGIGLLVGLIVLTRVPEVVAFFIPILWGVYDKASFIKRLQFFRKEYKYLLLGTIAMIIVFSPQIWYWYYVSGEFFFNPYQGESFNFLKPNIFKGWFNFRNGWLIYTPIMAFSLIGCFPLSKTIKGVVTPLLTFLILIAWIHYSYYVWNYYPGMGSRPMIECYPLLSFGLAAFFSSIQKKKALMWVPMILVGAFICLNLFQTWQMKKGIIWTQRGSTAFYLETFGRTKSSLNSLRAFDTRQFQPDLLSLSFVDTLYVNGFEEGEGDEENLTSEIKYSGYTSRYDTINKTHSEINIKIKETKVKRGDWIYAEIKAFRKSEDMEWHRDDLENLVFELIDEKGKNRKWASIKIASHIGNDKYSIWHCGKPNIWGEAGFFIKMPKNIKQNWSLKAYILNTSLKKIYLDDMKLLLYRNI